MLSKDIWRFSFGLPHNDSPPQIGDLETQSKSYSNCQISEFQQCIQRLRIKTNKQTKTLDGSMDEVHSLLTKL